MDTQNLLTDASVFATKVIAGYSNSVIYHDIKFAHRLVKLVGKMAKKSDMSELEINIAKSVAWFFSCGYADLKVEVEETSFKANNIDNALNAVNDFFEKHEYPQTLQEQVTNAISHLRFPYTPENDIENLVGDAILFELMKGKNGKNLRKYYDEWLLHGVSVGKANWYELAQKQVEGFQFHFSPTKDELLKTQEAVIKLLKKEKKSLELRSDIALKKELNITDTELKALKKNLSKAKGRDDRGIQTLFRTTSKNHYTLNQMVDTKASIMITVNSIIISLILGGIIGEESIHHTLKVIPIIVLLLTCIISIIYAVLSIRPLVTQGEFSEDEIRSKSGNLLYYGNFHNMRLRDYEWGVLQMINDSDYLYSSIIRDIYYLGTGLNVKYGWLRKSLNFFLYGLITVIILYVTVNIFAPDLALEHKTL